MQPNDMQQYADERIARARKQADAYRQVRKARAARPKDRALSPGDSDAGQGLLPNMLAWLKLRLRLRGSG